MIRALLLTLFLVPSLAMADEVAPVRWGIRAAIGASVNSDRAMDIASKTDAIFTGEIVFSMMPNRKWRALDLELGWMGSGSSGTAFQMYSTSLSTNSVVVGARYRKPLLRWLNVYGRLGATLDWSSLSVQELDLSSKVSDVAFTAGVLGGAGIELVGRVTDANDRTRVEFGGFIELGYVQRINKATFNELTPDGATETKPERIPFTPINAGSIDLSAPYWRLGAVLRF